MEKVVLMRYREFSEALAEVEQHNGDLELANPRIAIMTEDLIIYVPRELVFEVRDDADGSTLWIKAEEF